MTTADEAWEYVKAGDTIELTFMPNDPDPIEKGEWGTVIDKIVLGPGNYQLWVEWDSGRNLALVHNAANGSQWGDEFRILDEEAVIAKRRAQERIAADFEFERDRIRDTREFFPRRPRTREERATIMGSWAWSERR